MRQDLARSILAVFHRMDGGQGFDRGAADRLILSIRSAPVRPATFAVYTELIESILAEEFGEAEILARLLLDIPAPEQGTRIITLSDEAMGPGQAARHARIIDDDPDRRLGMQPALSDSLDRPRHQIDEAMGLLDSAAPELAGELRALTREIIMVGPGMYREPFGGATSVYVWGSITLCVDPIEDRLRTALSLVHEATHLLLFGLALGTPLVENEANDRFRSPFRTDPRPMEGIVHAAYVLARLRHAANELVSSGQLTDDEAEAAKQEATTCRTRFVETLPTIEAAARFTEIGRAIFQGAVGFMRR